MARGLPEASLATPSCVSDYAAALELCGFSFTQRRALDSLVREMGCATGVREFLQRHNLLEGTLEEVAARQRSNSHKVSGVRALFIGDEDYPPLLKRIPSAPAFVFVRGETAVLKRRCIAVVGTRAASDRGRHLAESIAKDLADAGVTVVSGMARGIDASAHRAALASNKGATAAVIGTALDKTYPADHRDLQEQIAKKGVVLSHFPIGFPVSRYTFPERNRIMSGVSEATVVIEAGDTSGAVIQARQCLSQGRALFFTPLVWDARSKHNWPITYRRRGARLVTSAKELLHYLDVP